MKQTITLCIMLSQLAATIQASSNETWVQYLIKEPYRAADKAGVQPFVIGGMQSAAVLMMTKKETRLAGISLAMHNVTMQLALLDDDAKNGNSEKCTERLIALATGTITPLALIAGEKTYTWWNKKPTKAQHKITRLEKIEN